MESPRKAGSSQYTIMMKQNGDEMEMSSHCSTGQKLLASLVIRIAIQQVFCSNCAVIALDEPTANLDREHMRAFATEIVNITRTKKKEEKQNFQLILITHSDQFTEEIQQSNFEYSLYEISQKTEGNVQYSIVKRRQFCY
jgi:DNA repair protein RAD50